MFLCTLSLSYVIFRDTILYDWDTLSMMRSTILYCLRRRWGILRVDLRVRLKARWFMGKTKIGILVKIWGTDRNLGVQRKCHYCKKNGHLELIAMLWKEIKLLMLLIKESNMRTQCRLMLWKIGKVKESFLWFLKWVPNLLRNGFFTRLYFLYVSNRD